MVSIYCRTHHNDPTHHRFVHGESGEVLCDECARLLEYALKRMEHCPRKAVRTSCRKCPVHCYAPAEREAMRSVMRYVGPRMILYHPLMAIRHALSEVRGLKPKT